MKKTLIAAVAALAATAVMAQTTEKGKVMDFSLGSRGLNIFATMNLVTYAVPDPKVRGVTCHIQLIEARGITLQSNPANTSIACRQTGPMFREDIDKIAKGPKGEVIFAEGIGGLDIFGRNSSIFRAISGVFKEINMSRIWDEENQTLVYVSYTTRLIDGSPKTSLSTVPTYRQLQAQ
jgi:CreA protein